MPQVLELPLAVRRTIAGALLVGTFMSSLEVMVVGPAMPAVVGDLGGAGLYPWVFTAYILTNTLSIPFYGWMADRFGRRQAYALGVALFGLGSVLCALAPDMGSVVAGRAVQGLGGGALATLTITIFGDLYEVDDRTRMQGWFSVIWGVSSLLGPLVGGFVTQAWSWRGIFWLNLPPGIVATAAVLALLPSNRQPREHRSFLAGVARLARNRVQVAVAISGLALGAALLGILGYLPVQIQAIGGGTPIDAGIALIPLSLAWTTGSNVAGRILKRVGYRWLIRAGTGLCALGAGVAAAWTAHPVGLALYGLGMGLAISTCNVASQEAAPNDLVGTATSMALLARSLGSAASVPLFGMAAGFATDAADFSAIPGLPQGVASVFVGVFGCCVVALLTAIALFPPQVAQD